VRGVAAANQHMEETQIMIKKFNARRKMKVGACPASTMSVKYSGIPASIIFLTDIQLSIIYQISSRV